jgi:predicted dehydrogenase
VDAVRFALIGCGSMAGELADSLVSRTDARVTAVVDPVSEARQRAAEAYQAEGYAEHAEALARDDIDAVIVATPTHLHKEIVIDAAQAQKHVFCEKPMALTVSDCDQMIAAAEAAGVRLMVGQVLRLMFPFWRIKELATPGELGTPVCVSIRRLMHLSETGWRGRRAASGGPLFEVHVHEFDLMRHLCGEVAQISAYGGQFLTEGVDYYDICLVNLQFRSGAVGHLHGGRGIGGHVFEGRIICPGGTLSFGPEWGTGAMQRAGEDPEALRADSRSGPVGIDWELDSFVQWVLRGKPPVVTARDGRAAVELAVAAYRSIEEGRPVDIAG